MTSIPDEKKRARVAKRFNAVANKLEMREREIVRLRYGVDLDRPRTLEEVGRIFKVTRERIRQIEKKTLEKMARLAR